MNRPRFPEGIILSHAKTTSGATRKHLAALHLFGITEAFLDEFEANIRAGESLPKDLDYQQELKGLTWAKEEVLAACNQWVRVLRLRMQLAFGNNSAEYKSFPAAQCRKAAKNKSRMISLMELLLQFAEKYQSRLAIYGQTPEVIQQGETLCQQLIAADSAQELKKTERRVATQKRYAHFHQLYETVNTIRKVGRMVFADNAAYLTLFESPWPKRGSAVKKRKVSGGERVGGLDDSVFPR